MKILVVESRYHTHIADALMNGATRALEQGGATFQRATFPGALELPAAIAVAARTQHFDGYVALGCVLRSAGFHFGVIASESAAGLMRLGVEHALCIGNGIIAAENEAEAWRLADPAQGDAGGDAARACLTLIAHQRRLGALA